jgi:hypothetical protein
MSGQLKKLFYDKRFVDSPDGEASAKWSLSPWKVFTYILAGFIGLIIIYAFVATPDPHNFLGNIVFYAIVIVGAVAVLWLVGNGIYKGRKLISGFFLSFILIISFYWALGFLLNYFNILSFHMGGYALWFMITVLAGIGANKIDGNLNRSDVGYGLLVFLICIGSNIPIANGQGFLWNLDNFILSLLGVSEFIPWV